MAAPAYRSHTVVTNGTSTSAALSLPAGFASGDILIAVVMKENTAAFDSTPSGFALVTGGRDTNSFYSVDVYWKRADGTESGSQTFTWTGSVPRAAYLVAISGAITSGDPWDPATLAAWTYSSSGAMAAGSVTTTVDETLILGIYTVDNGGATWTSGSSMTERIDNGDTYLQTVEQASAGATGTKSATPSVNNERKGWLLPIQPDAGSPDVTVNASLLTATLTLPTASVVIGSPVTVNASLLTNTLSLPALPVPTFVAAGTSAWTATNAATISPGLPTGRLDNDIHILIAHRSDNTAMTDLSGSGWTQIAALSGNNTAAQRVEVWWKRFDSGTDVAPVITFGSGTIVRGARIFGVRGCPTVGDPFATPSRSNNAASATVSTTNITPSVPSLGLFLYAYEDDPTAASTPTNWGAFTITTSTLGSDGAIGASVRPFIFGTSYGTPSTTVSGGTFANSVNVGILLPMLAPVDVLVRPEMLSLTTTLADASAVGESGGGAATVNAALLTNTLTLFAPSVTAVQTVTVSPSLLSAALTLPAPTISTTSTATVTPSLLTLTSSLFDPAVSAVRTATVTPSLVSLTATVSSATASAVQTATVSPSLLTATLSLPASTVSAAQNVTASATLQTATLSLFAPTISTTSTATVTPSVLVLTATLLTATASAGGTVTVQPSALTATLSLNAPTVTAVRTATVTPALLTGTLSLAAPSVSGTSTATVATSLLTGTLSLFAPTISAGGATTINAPLLTLTASVNAPTVSTVRSVTVTPATMALSVSLSAPSVGAGTAATVTPSALSLALSLPAPSVDVGTGVTITPSLLTATASVLAAGISTTQSVTATPAQIVAAITLLTPSINDYQNNRPATVGLGATLVGGAGIGASAVGGVGLGVDH